MRAFVFALAAFALAGCPSRGGCPVDTISSASQCIPIADMAAAVPSDLAGLTAACPPASALATGQPLPPCAIGTRCDYPDGNDDAGAGTTECDCRPDHTWICLAK